jgi:hypothetical protein
LNNLKTGKWVIYKLVGEPSEEDIFEGGVLIKTIDLSNDGKNDNPPLSSDSFAHESTFPGGEKVGQSIWVGKLEHLITL